MGDGPTWAWITADPGKGPFNNYVDKIFYYLDVDIFYPKRGKKETFFDYLPTSSCPHSF